MNRRGLEEPSVSVVDCTGVTIGNADIEASSQWSPPQSPPERAPLPGHEHEADWSEIKDSLPIPQAPRGIL